MLAIAPFALAVLFVGVLCVMRGLSDEKQSDTPPKNSFAALVLQVFLITTLMTEFMM